jgi:WD40 repeat protein
LFLFVYISTLKVWIGLAAGPINSYNLTASSITPGTSMIGNLNRVNTLIRINQNQVATASADFTVRVWNITSSALINTYNAHTASAYCLVVLPGGFLASGGYDSTIRIWDMQNNQVRTLNLPTTNVFSIKIHPIYEYMVVNSNTKIYFYNTTTLSLIQSNTTNRNYTSMEILLPSGNLIMGGSYLDIYKLPSCSLNFTQSITHNAYRMNILPDNVTLVIGRTVDGILSLFNSVSYKFGSNYTAHSSTIVVLTVTPDHAYLISGGQDNLLAVWQWSTMNLTLVKSINVASALNAALILETVYNGKKKGNW